MAPFPLFKKQLGTLAQERFSSPTEVQQATFPLIHEGKNALVIAETGSGKTEAVLLPFFDRMLRDRGRPFQLLYITPLRSLNRDLLSRVLWWANRLDFTVSVRHGDTSQYERSMQAANPADMLIVTPETLQAILVGKVLRTHLANVRFVVIDEAHELPDSKRGTQLAVGLERLKALITEYGNPSPQLVGISATVGSPTIVSSFLAGSSDPLTVITADRHKEFSITVDEPVPTQDDHEVGNRLYVGPGVAARIRTMHNLIKTHAPVLSFTNTREAAEVLASRLKTLDPELGVETHHSSLSRDVRISAEQRFKDNELAALICTSSLELGIDIGHVDLVLQYLSPRQAVKLAQRVGRAGHRHDKVSRGVVLTQDTEDGFEAAVIAKRTLEGWVEPTILREQSLDVLAHQLIGLTLERKDITFLDAYTILKRAYPYRNLSADDLFDVARFMMRLRLLRIEDPAHPMPWQRPKTQEDLDAQHHIKPLEEKPTVFTPRPALKKKNDLTLHRKLPSWEYYYTNLSTIPDSKNVQLFDVVNHAPVGSLDAEFVSLYAQPGATIITKGTPWRVLETRDHRVSVEPASGIKAAIPAWQGELIPVHFEIAQDVGKLRRLIAETLDNNEDPISFLTTTYPVTKQIAKDMVSLIKKQRKKGILPDDKTIVIDRCEDKLVIHFCGGSLVNDTLGRALSVLLTGKIGTIGLQTDPYRIILTVSPEYAERIKTELTKLTTKTFQDVLHLALEKTDLFFLRFAHVAKRFGIISRDADIMKAQLRRIVQRFDGSPVYRETFNELRDKFDVDQAIDVLQNIREGTYPIIINEGMSPLARFGVSRKTELVATEKPESEIFALFKKRLLGTRIGLLCCQCNTWGTITTAEEVSQQPVCKKCQARLIAIVPRDRYTFAHSLLEKNRQGKPLSGEEKKEVETMFASASLVIDHGYEAVRALAGRGLGPKTAARVLSKLLHGDDLLHDILDAERQFVKTRQFWKG
ncbi:MAG: DEAD/DEAH box helicase [Nanoarchaeota archaeon]|nr:DEAD/DEAH box helicase [Nanoarchaeota archaeon]